MNHDSDESPIQPAAQGVARRRSFPLVRWGVSIGVALLVLVGTAELWARFVLGLGDPPLMQTDPEIEYLFKPSQTYSRFGNRIAYNSYSMRSDEFPPEKEDPQELRLLVIGDSVINGGNLTDQSDLATEQLKVQLQDHLDRPVVIGNISAGSWGPPNQLAYIKRFGTFQADVIIIVLSSHDYADAPTFEPTVGVHPGFPEQSPHLAVTEGITRYLPRYLSAWTTENAADESPSIPESDAIARCSEALRNLIELSQAGGADVFIAQHLERSEIANTTEPGHVLIAGIARGLNVPIIQLGPLFQNEIDAGRMPYRDNVHPNELGHRLIAEALFEATIASLRPPPVRANGERPPAK